MKVFEKEENKKYWINFFTVQNSNGWSDVPAAENNAWKEKFQKREKTKSWVVFYGSNFSGLFKMIIGLLWRVLLKSHFLARGRLHILFQKLKLPIWWETLVGLNWNIGAKRRVSYVWYLQLVLCHHKPTLICSVCPLQSKCGNHHHLRKKAMRDTTTTSCFKCNINYSKKLNESG